MNTYLKLVLGALIGICIGFLGGFQGIAGGFYISLLLLSLGIVDTQRKAAGTTLLAVVFPLSAGALMEYYKTGDIDIKLGLIITAFYIIFATLGAKFNAKVPEQLTVLSLAVSLMLTSLVFFYQYMTKYNKK
jgi:uncharacterized protein